MKRSALLALGFVLAASLHTAAQPAPTGKVIKAAAYVGPDGKLVSEGAVVAIEGERIARVGGDVPAGTPVDEYAGAVLSPGLVDCLTTLGVLGDLAERQTALQPDVRAADAFNRFARELRAALAAGVTTFALVPSDDALVGGSIAICQTGGPEGKPRMLERNGPLKLSLSQDAFKTDREPTSRSGALGLLREALQAGRSVNPPASDAGAASWTPFARGQRPGVMTAPSAADVLAALDLVDEFKLRLALIHTEGALDIAGRLRERVAAIVVGPLDMTSGLRATRGPRLLAQQQVPVAIAGGLPGYPADTLRIGAALAARAGLDPGLARQAIAAVPADVLGVGERVGALAPGRQADVVVFSGDPLDLRSRVLAVYIGGQRVYLDGATAATGVRP
ncbi:MAG: hypothetical protein AB1716_10210 [Planctomycetota bacterium]